MATYTSGSLYGLGSLGENLTQATTYTFAFTNNAPTTNYFTFETIPNPSGFYVSGSTPLNISGAWVVSSSMNPGFVTSSYIASVVVPPGNSSLTFTPATNVVGTTYYLKGTGALNLTIS